MQTVICRICWYIRFLSCFFALVSKRATIISSSYATVAKILVVSIQLRAALMVTQVKYDDHKILL